MLDKPVLTYADYESAVLAWGQCITERIPQMRFEATPSAFMDGMLDVQYGRGAEFGESDGAVGADGSAGQSVSAPSSAGSGEPSDDETEVSNGTGVMPDSIVDDDRVVGECELIYAAQVEDRWQSQLVLGAQQVSVEMPKFLQCMTDAGVVLPADRSDAGIRAFLQTPAWSQTLTEEQGARANACIAEHSTLVNTITQ
ncbi:hypothetical protein [Xylanimonas sp. McL0601]|uniref:hypothetical protein n=1 Tax=Xylanimonas sp. McL0601 TaxID=3414739 RepID=UPI003CF60C50